MFRLTIFRHNHIIQQRLDPLQIYHNIVIPCFSLYQRVRTYFCGIIDTHEA